MDEFFSKYGWVVATGVIIAIVIGMMTPIGDAISAQVIAFINQFATNIIPTT